jgi:hypothetical protein
MNAISNPLYASRALGRVADPGSVAAAAEPSPGALRTAWRWFAAMFSSLGEGLEEARRRDDLEYLAGSADQVELERRIRQVERHAFFSR